MKIWMVVSVLSTLFVAPSGWSQVTVNDEYETVIERPIFQSSSKVILDQKKINESKAQNLTTLLATQGNMTVSNSAMQPGSIYLRGGDASHVLILVDGLPFYDASTVQRTMNLNDLDIKTIRRIEILKGSQSVLYGGQALSGVIKIETFPQEIAPATGGLLEFGDRRYRKLSVAGFHPINPEAGLLARGQFTTKENRSPILGSTQIYPSSVSSGEVGYLEKGYWNFFAKAQQIHDKADITNSNFATYAAVDATGFKAETDIKSVSMGLSSQQVPWQPKLLVGYQISDKSFVEPTVTNSKYGGSLWNVRFESQPIDLDSTQLLVGASYLKEALLYREQSVEMANAFNEQKGLFLKSSYQPVTWVALEAGARTDFYKSQERTESYQLGVTFFDQLKFEYATGFKTPSLFQLYASYGNPDLQPEKSRSYSMSYDVTIGDRQSFSASVFETRFDGLITTSGSYPNLRYLNVAKAVTRGVEAQYSYESQSQLRTDLAFGYQEPRDLQNNRWLLRRPLQTGSVRLTQKLDDKIEAGVEVVGNGERIDNSGPGGQYTSLARYFVTNIFASCKTTDSTSLYIRGNNIGNERFEESRGYHNEGDFYLVGFEISN